MKSRFRSNSRKKPKLSDSGYLLYTSIAYQLIATISVAFIVGYILDRLSGWPFPVFKLIFSFGGVIVALYSIFKKLMKKK
ncbi:MAG: AtpZ/AtpI family protein [Chitinophagales bacterium]|nr:AtpZ/AtpI family protein [Chitinophagales bacterium]